MALVSHLYSFCNHSSFFLCSPPTPPKLYQYRTILEPGTRAPPRGNRFERSVLAKGAEDIVHGVMTCGTTHRDFLHAAAKAKATGTGIVEEIRRGGPAVTTKSIVQPEVDINASLVAKKAEENYYKSSKREPLGKGYSGEITLPAKVLDPEYRFGGKERKHIDIKEILNPPNNPNAEIEQEKEKIYQKSHKSFPAGVQYRGGVDWDLTNVDPTEQTFGLPSSYEGTATSNVQGKGQRSGHPLTEEEEREKLLSKKATLLFKPSSMAECIQPEVSDPPVEVMRGGNILGNTVTSSDFAQKRRDMIATGQYETMQKITKADANRGIVNGTVDVQFIRAPGLTRIIPKVQLDRKDVNDPPLGRSAASGTNFAATLRNNDVDDMEDTLQATSKLNLPKGVYTSEQRVRMQEITDAYQEKKRIERSDLSMTVAGALTGNFESQELRPDHDLGNTKTLGFRNTGMAHPDYRFGQTIIRNTTDSTSFSRTKKPPSLLATDMATVREVIHSSGNSGMFHVVRIVHSDFLPPKVQTTYSSLPFLLPL